MSPPPLWSQMTASQLPYFEVKASQASGYLANQQVDTDSKMAWPNQALARTSQRNSAQFLKPQNRELNKWLFKSQSWEKLLNTTTANQQKLLIKGNS